MFFEIDRVERRGTRVPSPYPKEYEQDTEPSPVLGTRHRTVPCLNFAKISFIYKSDPSTDTDYAESKTSYTSPDPFDEDDDYFDDEDNFASTQKVGKRKGNTPQNNQKQNQDFDRVAKDLGLSLKERNILHNKISGRGLGFWELLEFAKTLFMIMDD